MNQVKVKYSRVCFKVITEVFSALIWIQGTAAQPAASLIVLTVRRTKYVHLNFVSRASGKAHKRPAARRLRSTLPAQRRGAVRIEGAREVNPSRRGGTIPVVPTDQARGAASSCSHTRSIVMELGAGLSAVSLTGRGRAAQGGRQRRTRCVSNQ